MGIAVWVTIAGAVCFNVYSIMEMNNLQHYYSSLCSEGVMARVRERILSKILHRNAEYFDHKETRYLESHFISRWEFSVMRR